MPSPTVRSSTPLCQIKQTAPPGCPVSRSRRWAPGPALLGFCLFVLVVPGSVGAETSGDRSLEASSQLFETSPLAEESLAAAATLLRTEFWAERALDRLAPEIVLPETPTVVWARLGTIAAIPVLGITLLLIFVWTRIPWRVRRAGMDHERFTRLVLNEPPEVVATRLLGRPPPDAFEEMLERLEQQDRLKIEVVVPATATTPARVQLHLRVDPDTLHPVEQKVLHALFGESTELRSDLHRARHHESGFDPEEITEDFLMRGAFPSGGRAASHRPSLLLAGLLLVSGLALALLELRHDTQGIGVLALGLVAAGVVFLLTPRRWWHAARGAIAAWRWLLPLGLATLLALALHLLAPEPLSPAAGAVLALLLLSGFVFALASTRGFDPVIEQHFLMQQARKWARREQREPGSSTPPEWRRHLLALGLTAEFGNGPGSQENLDPGSRPAVARGWGAAFHLPPAGNDLIPF